MIPQPTLKPTMFSIISAALAEDVATLLLKNEVVVEAAPATQLEFQY